MMKFVASNLFGFERDETAGDIIVYRAVELFLAYLGSYYAWTWALYIPKISTFVLPLGIAGHVDIGFMYNGWAAFVNAILISTLLAAGVFKLWRPAWLIAVLLLHLQYVSRYILGEISHGAHFVGMSILAIGLSAVVFADRRNARRAGMGLIFFFIGIGYTSAATCKLVATGPQWIDGAHLWMWIAERNVDDFSTVGTLSENVFQSIILANRPIATMILGFGLVTELSGFLLWFRRTRPFIGVFIIMMHLGIVASMRISFTANTLLVALIALPWPLMLDGALRMLDSGRTRRVDRGTAHS